LAATYTPIASVTLEATALSVTFSSIPQNYTDLVIIVNAKNTNNSESTKSCFLRFNGDSSSLYSYTWVDGNGSSVASYRDSGANRAYYGEIINSYNVNASNFSQFNININNYSNTTTYKTTLSRSSNPFYPGIICSLYRSTSAITSVQLLIQSTDQFVVGSTFNLYGIQAGNA
jgi:hypothetical protein